MPTPYITLSNDIPVMEPGDSINLVTGGYVVYNLGGTPYSASDILAINIRDDSPGGGYLTVNGEVVPSGSTANFLRVMPAVPGPYDYVWSSLSSLEFHAASGDDTDAIIINAYVDGYGDMNSATVNNNYRTNVIVTDEPDVIPEISASSSSSGSMTEGGSVTYTVTLSAPTTTDVYVYYSLDGRGGNADDFTSQVDFSTSSPYFLIPAGQTQGQVTVTAVADGIYDGGTEYYSLNLTSVTGNATIGSQSTFIGTIYDLDSPPSAGEVAISANQTQVQEGDFATVAVSFTVTRSGGSDGAVSVPWSISHGGANATDFAGATSGSVQFAAGSTQPQTITVYIAGDTDVESLYESFSVTLGAPSGGATVGTGSASVTIVDDDTAPAEAGSFEITPAVGSATEGAGAFLEFNVDRTGGSDGAVSVEWYLVSGGADSNDFTSAVFDTLNFADGVTRQNIRLDVFDDLLVEGTEDVQIRLVNPTGGAEISNGLASGTLADNDAVSGFRDPVGDGTVTPERYDDDSAMAEDGFDGWYDAQGFYDGTNHLASDWNSDLGGDRDIGFPVYAAHDGVVVDVIDPIHSAPYTTAELNGLWWRGQSVIIRHDLPNGETIYTHYAHLQNVDTALIGQSVSTGQQIGEIGPYPDNNPDTAAHVHFEIRGAEDPNMPIETGQGPGYRGGLHIRTDQFGVEYVLIGNTRYYDPIGFVNTRRDDATGGTEAGGGGSSEAFTEFADSVTLTAGSNATALAGNDTVVGSPEADTIMGGIGDDSLSGSGGADLLRGDRGEDNLNGGTGGDTVAGGADNDTVNGDSGHDRLFGSSGNDLLRGGDDNDSLDGGTGEDTLSGNAGDDDVSGGAGNDLMFGGSGDDTLRGDGEGDTLDGGRGEDVLAGNDGNDLLRGDTDADRLFGGAGDDTLAGNEGTDSLSGGLNNDLLYGGSAVDTLSGGAGDDTIHGGAAGDSMSGDADNDAMFGGGGSDTMRGGDGDDRVSGDNEDDLLVGGFGNDTVMGGAGNDQIYGGADNDLLAGNDDDDTLDGGFGDDVLRGNDGNDHLNAQDGADEASGGNGMDVILGRAGDDTLRGGNQDDRLYGGANDDLVAGNDGDDDVLGGSGDDRLFGGAGDDTITGNAGMDYMAGGLGEDVFVFQSAGDSPHGNSRDVIADFQSGVDQIDLSGLGTGLTFVASYSGMAGEVRYNDTIGRLYADMDGDSTSDFSIVVLGAPVLHESDLIL